MTDVKRTSRTAPLLLALLLGLTACANGGESIKPARPSDDAALPREQTTGSDEDTPASADARETPDENTQGADEDAAMPAHDTRDAGSDGTTKPGDGEVSHMNTTVAYDSDGQNLAIKRPRETEKNDLLILALHRTDDDLPLKVMGWTHVAQCYKTGNGEQCATATDCETWNGPAFCKTFKGYGAGQDLAQSIFYKVVKDGEPDVYRFNLNRDASGHPAWALLTALRGADLKDPIRDWANVGCDKDDRGMFPPVMGRRGDMLLLSLSFDDMVPQSTFRAPLGTSPFGYVSRSDEAGFMFGRVLTSSGETGVMATRGSGASACKDALVSHTVRAQNDESE